ncbi:MAG: extracellular solute-binding protein [Lentisphaerae bacterium]|nr:extracellular solute-binding protein [Lentisphaerota bacterium]
MNRSHVPALLLFLALAAVLLLPFLLQPAPSDLAMRRPAAGGKSDNRSSLIIVSPHNEAVRYEFERAFRRWHQQNFGMDITIDWRNIGGTSEIVRYLDGEFAAAERTGRTGIGIDLFFGGGAYDHAQQARKGHLLSCGVRARQPEILAETIIPATFSGEVFYDPLDRWYGCCLSSFGICWNSDALANHGITAPPQQWADLANFQFFRLVALADPTKSGSINKAFEMLIQEQLRAELNARGVAAPGRARAGDAATTADLAAGWRRAMGLIRRIGANARYFTDSASKVPLDVAQGNAAAGMCIDFYGRFTSEMVTRNENSPRMNYLTPEGGSSISVDPISLLRGAPQREFAERFIDFCLSPKGQLLWNSRVGTPGGPERYALRRLPIRKDMYAPLFLATMSDPDVAPYAQGQGLTYHATWTAPLFSLIRTLIRAMCIDTHAELTQAWEAINRGGSPETCPDAYAAFLALPPNAEYDQALAVTAGQLNNKLTEARLTREWIIFFRNQYRQARELAEKETKQTSNVE